MRISWLRQAGGQNARGLTPTTIAFSPSPVWSIGFLVDSNIWVRRPAVERPLINLASASCSISNPVRGDWLLDRITLPRVTVIPASLSARVISASYVEVSGSEYVLISTLAVTPFSE